MKSLVSTIAIIFFSGQCLLAQSAHKLLVEGDKSYINEEYLTAEENYRKAQEKKSTTKSNFNLGNAVYQQDRYEEAVQHYENTFNIAENDIEKANALYNLGNAQLKSGQIEPAIESYKRANAHNPDDSDILKNLYMAKLMMQQQQQQEQEQQQEQQEQNQEQLENQNNDQQEQQEQQEGDQEQEQQPQDSDIENQSEQEQQAPQEQELSKEDALKLLEVIENEEKNVQEKLRKMSGKKKKPKKDW